MAAKTIDTEDRVEALAVRTGQEGHTKPLLALRTYVPQRATIDINGDTYEMHLLDEFSAVRRQRVINIWGRALNVLQRVQQDEEISDAEERLVDDAYVRVIEAACPEMPREVVRALSTTQREELVAFFFRMTGEAEPTTAADEPTATGA